MDVMPRLLIICDNAGVVKTLDGSLNRSGNSSFTLVWVREMASAIKRLHAGDIDAILVDLSLPDGKDLTTIDSLFAAAPHTPTMFLAMGENAIPAVPAMQLNARVTLAEAHLDSPLLPQLLHQMIRQTAAEERLFIEKMRNSITLDSISDAVASTDSEGKVDYINIQAQSMTGWSGEEAHGHPISEVMQLINATSREPELNPIYLVLQKNKPVRASVGTLLVRRDGWEATIESSAAPVLDRHGDISGAVLVFHDSTTSQTAALKMAHLAQHDFLTNLPNRVLLNDRIEQAVTMAKRRGTHLALLFLDLDNFKHINDSLGHAIGDKLLQAVAKRLLFCVRNSDTVSRQGGDEFVLLVPVGRFVEDAALAAVKIIGAMTVPHFIDDYELYVTTSIGISVYPEDGPDAETLIRNADTAMYHAKEKGRNNYQFFTRAMNVKAVERQIIEANLRRAMVRHEFVVYYQPMVTLDTGTITGAEALLRWRHPQWGETLPDRFVTVAEDCGLIVPIGHWVLREACAQTKLWNVAGMKPITIAVNISALELRSKGFVEGVQTILEETGLSPDCLQLDITESVLMNDTKSSIAILLQLKSMGVRLALDNFGTGFSSLRSLFQFPIDVLKIDRSLVQGIGSGNGKGTMVSIMIAMGAGLHQQVVAGGVEEQEQLDFLRAQHCDEGQGYLFSHPLAAKNFTTLLATA